MTSNVTMVFLHGAGTGAWVWERVIERLSFLNLALDVPGRVGGVTPDSCAAALFEELDRKGVASVILVLHSLSGVLAPGLAARLGSRLQRIVYVAAVIPPDGGSFVDSLSFVYRLVLRLLFRRGPATYIKLSMDRSVSPRQQDSMIMRLDNPRIREVEAGHLAMLSAPAALAKILEVEAQLTRQGAPGDAPLLARP